MLDYEMFHLNAENRKNGDYIKVLHPDYREFGQSGGIFKLNDFKGQPLDANEYAVKFFEALELSESARLCTYTLVDKTNNVSSRRSSVWVM